MNTVEDKMSSVMDYFYLSSDVIIVVDGDSNIISINKEAETLFNISRADTIGKSFCDLIVEHFDASDLARVNENIRDKNDFLNEIFHKESNRWFKVDIHNYEGNSHLIILKDITDRKLNKQKLLDNDKKAKMLISKLKRTKEEKDRFISTIAHELRNPLATISMGLSLMEHTEPGSDIDIETKEILKRQTAQLIRLVDDLMNTSIISRNKLQIKKEEIELNKLIRELIKEYICQFQSKEIELREEYSTQPIYIYVDPMRIKQVIGNLLSNALKFTEEKGLVGIIIDFNQKEKVAIIEVSDTGIGIEAKALSGLFEPFLQIEDSTARNIGGLGLGLSIVKGIIDSHGGTIRAESEGLGKGTRFIIKLPLGD